MTMSKGVIFLIFGILIGIPVGISIGILTSPATHETASPSSAYGNATMLEIAKKAVEFMNSELVKPGIRAYLINATPGKYFYKVMVRVMEGNKTITVDDIYVSKDGNFIAFNIAELTKVEKAKGVDIGNAPVLGNPNAEVKIVAFSDYSNPLTADFELNVLPKLMEKYDVCYAFKDYPVSKVGAKAALAANCARAVGKFWEYHRILLERQSEWTENLDKLYDYAQEMGINRTWFERCVENETFFGNIREYSHEGLLVGVRMLPTVFIDGFKVSGVQKLDVLERIIEKVEKGQS